MSEDVVPRPLGPHHAHCFGCGERNPAELGLRFAAYGDRVRSPLRLQAHHQGAPGFAHGGILAAALDDTIGTLLLILRRPAVTAKLEVDFRAPAFIDRDYVVEAWTERVDGRKLHFAADIRDADGTVVAEATALFLVVDIEHFQLGGSDMAEHVKQRWMGGEPELPY